MEELTPTAEEGSMEDEPPPVDESGADEDPPSENPPSPL